MTDAAEVLAQALNPEHWSDPRYEAHREKDIEDARAALAKVLDAVTLEWSGPLSSGRFAAWSPLGTFTIYRTHSGFSWQEPLVGNGGYVDTLAAAQAAALADYRARLAKALGMGEG